jgi:hypothetical protein
VASAPIFIPVLAGDRLERPFEALPRSAPCAALVARERTQWLVVYRRPLLSAVVPLAVHKCLPGLRPALEDRYFTVYPPLMRQPR